jgi:hypothetical protein
MVMKCISKFLLFLLLFFTVSCNKDEIDVEQENLMFNETFSEINAINGVEEYEGFYYIEYLDGKTAKLPSKEYCKGILYIMDIKKDAGSLCFYLSNGDVRSIECENETLVKFRLPNIKSLRTDGYDLNLDIVLNNINSVIRINHGEPNINGIVCSSFIDFKRGKIGYFNPYSVDEEKTDEILVENEQTISFEQGHHYSIISSKIDGCIASITITDNDGDQTYQFSPEIGCYESGITNGWGRSSYEIVGDIDVMNFKIYSNQPYHSKLLILGDSNADHGGIGDYKWKNYARQIKTGLQGNAYLIVQGGASTNDFLVWLQEYALDVCAPQYCMITTYNEYTFSKWIKNIKEIINILENHHIIPILATIHPGSGEMISDDKRKMNDWMRSSGYLVFDMARVISKDHDGVTTIERLLRLPTLVHFNFEANDMLAADFFDTFPFMKTNEI